MLRDWWRSLERAPDPLSRGEWGAVIAASVVAALSRVLALARTPWDWDELLFLRALEHFDVAQHRPHPPGFPLYILAAKIVRRLGFDGFHALQAVGFVAAIAIVPAMVFLCRELRMRMPGPIFAAILLAFSANVWIYGGGAFSDVPSMTLIVFAAGLLLAGCRSDRAYLAGALVLAISAGFRPQNLLVGIVPFLIASAFRRKTVVLAGALIVTAIVALSYGTAAWLTGWSEYRQALQAHRAYIVRVDSYRSPTRPPLWRVAYDFLVMPYHAVAIHAIVTFFAAIGILRRRPPALVALAAFGPLAILSWLMLDHFSASRFSIGYMPMIAILAAEGLTTARAKWTKPAALFVLLVVIGMMVWTWPALTTLRNEVSPPVQAIDSIRTHIDPRGSLIDVETPMAPFAQWYLRDYSLDEIGESLPTATWERQPAYWLHENAASTPRGRLWDVFRHRYFDVSGPRVQREVVFGGGWYGEEGSASQPWRWMGGRSTAMLPPVAGKARLWLQIYVPLDALPAPPNVTIRVNGVVVDRFRASLRNSQREIFVHARGDRPNELAIETDRTVEPAHDPRVLGLRLDALEWTSAP